VNAAKYTPTGGHVRLVARRDGEQVVLEVRDNGMGISPELLPHLFDLFFQQPQGKDRSHGGLGLGLTIARSLTALHGGTLSARSDGPGRGSTFELRLPALELQVDEVMLPRDRGRQGLAATSPGARVLVVDDNVDSATMLKEALAAAGHLVQLAFDGPGALQLVDQFTPDVALLDLGLPVMDGVELGRALRQRQGLEQVRLVAVTGYGQESDRQHTRAAGFDAHVVKPFELTGLDALIRQLTDI
jgi:CheY-like chemotaxis protein